MFEIIYHHPGKNGYAVVEKYSSPQQLYTRYITERQTRDEAIAYAKEHGIEVSYVAD